MALPTPPDDRRCTSLNSRGARCKSWALHGEETCIAHTEGRQSIVVTDPAEAARLKAAKTQQAKEDAEHREHLRSLPLREQVRARIEERSAEIVDRLLELAKHPDPTVALRAVDSLWNRSYGRPVTPIVTAEVTEVNPLAQAFLELSPAERRALLTGAQPAPAQPDIEVDAEVDGEVDP
jgi:hypothetical protein